MICKFVLCFVCYLSYNFSFNDYNHFFLNHSFPNEECTLGFVLFFHDKKEKKKESYQGSYLWFEVKCANTFLRNICCSLIAKSSPTLCDPVDCSCPQAPLSMGSPSQEYWTGLLFLCPGDLLDPGIKLASPALAGSFFSTVPPRKPEKH